MLKHYHILFFLLLIFYSCGEQAKRPNPWGAEGEADAVSSGISAVSLDDIISNGELIMLTISGPETYYEYHGRGMGLHYLLCERFCQSIGVALRVDVCKDTTDMISRIERGEADVIAMPFRKRIDGLLSCAENASSGQWHWLVNQQNASLADTLNSWLTAEQLKKVDDEQSYWLSSRSITRHVYSPMLNKQKGIISNYDHLFRKYSGVARWDWRLLAAQCYQESTFDPQAKSWAGACGLMQIMPSTADHLGLARSDLFNAEKNVAAAAKYIAQLSRRFSDIGNPSERMKFVLASYNGGSHHIRDAMALAKKHGASPQKWSDVRNFVLRLAQPEFYNDPVVKYGYMRGTETADYVDRIWNRWLYYRGMRSSAYTPSVENSSGASSKTPNPHRSAKRKEKYNL